MFYVTSNYLITKEVSVNGPYKNFTEARAVALEMVYHDMELLRIEAKRLRDDRSTNYKGDK